MALGLRLFMGMNVPEICIIELGCLHGGYHGYLIAPALCRVAIGHAWFSQIQLFQLFQPELERDYDTWRTWS